MKIIIVGAGAAGVSAAINLKRQYPSYNILVIEHLDKPLKKILATGNGKCNLGNSNINFDQYNNKNFAKQIISNYDYKLFFKSLCLETKLIENLAYPVSESAASVRNALLNECKKLNINIQVNEELLDYEVKDKIYVYTNKNNYVVDKLILAGGLKSSPKLGSDGSILNILSKHNYEINEPKPGLSPLFIKEKINKLDGIRIKGKVTVLQDNKIVAQEDGELLFKNHGLSGIVIFNLLSKILHTNQKNIKISLDLLPQYSLDYLKEYYKKYSLENLLQAFIHPTLIDYLNSRFSNSNDLLNALKNLTFSYDKPYGFDFSQVSVGGVKINQIYCNLMSKFEKNVYIIGELLDIDGPCGGYNLTFAFACGFKL